MPQHVVRMNWYVTDIDAFWAVMEEVAGQADEWPATTGTILEVRSLAQAALLVEIEATAVK